MSKLAYNYLVKLITLRDYSEFKLRQKLKEKKYPANEIEDAINEIKTRGYLREDLYIEARIKGLLYKGYAINYIRQKLNQESLTVSEEYISDVFEDQQTSEEDQIRQLLKKKLRTAKDHTPEEWQKVKQKALRYTISKGHNISKTITLLKEFKMGQTPEEFGYASEFN